MTFSAQKMKYSITDLFTFTEEIRNEKLHFLTPLLTLQAYITRGTFKLMLKIRDHVLVWSCNKITQVLTQCFPMKLNLYL